MNRKTLFTAALLALTVLSTSAQKGKFYLSGSLGFDSYEDTQDLSTPDPSSFTSSTFSVLPDVGIFLKDDLQLGLRLGYNVRNFNSEGGFFEQESSERIFTPTLYLRKLFLVNEKFGFHSGISGNLLMGNGEESSLFEPDVQDEYELSGFGASVPVGAIYNVSKKVTFIISYDFLNFISETRKEGGEETGTHKEFSTALRASETRLNRFNAGFYFTFN